MFETFWHVTSEMVGLAVSMVIIIGMIIVMAIIVIAISNCIEWLIEKLYH
jgi:hypothetical protein